MLPPSVFRNKDMEYVMGYNTNNDPYFTYLEISLLGDCRKYCQRKKGSTLRLLIDAAQYCISRYTNSSDENRI